MPFLIVVVEGALAVYVALESDPEAAVALALVLLAVSIVILAMLREKWLRPIAGR